MATQSEESEPFVHWRLQPPTSTVYAYRVSSVHRT